MDREAGPRRWGGTWLAQLLTGVPFSWKVLGTLAVHFQEKRRFTLKRQSQHQETITDHNHTEKNLPNESLQNHSALVYYSRDRCTVDWVRKGNRFFGFHRADGVRGAKHGVILRKPLLGSQTKRTSQTVLCSASCSVLGHELEEKRRSFWTPMTAPCYFFKQSAAIWHTAVDAWLYFTSCLRLRNITELSSLSSKRLFDSNHTNKETSGLLVYQTGHNDFVRRWVSFLSAHLNIIKITHSYWRCLAFCRLAIIYTTANTLYNSMAIYHFWK